MQRQSVGRQVAQFWVRMVVVFGGGLLRPWPALAVGLG